MVCKMWQEGWWRLYLLERQEDTQEMQAKGFRGVIMNKTKRLQSRRRNAMMMLNIRRLRKSFSEDK